jgi:isopentenyl phosphate kinase
MLKIGGSILTDRSQFCVPRTRMVQAYAELILQHWGELAHHLILILGGGAFGHKVVERFALHHGSSQSPIADWTMLTLRIFEWKALFIETLRELGVPAYPFHMPSLICLDRAEIVSVHLEPIRDALRAGLLPVLTGDLILDRTLGYTLFSSDRVPEALVAGGLVAQRVAFFANCPGLLRARDAPETLVEEVTAENYQELRPQAGASEFFDVTGGMGAKFDVLVRLARQGIEGLLTDGRDPPRAFRSLLTRERPAGTVFAPWPGPKPASVEGGA